MHMVHVGVIGVYVYAMMYMCLMWYM